jgi:hypothetical protein
MPWVRLPSDWINYGDGLKRIQWKSDGVGSDATAALMALTAIAHHANSQSGIARLSYDALCFITGLSRAKLSNGLDVLELFASSNGCRKDAALTACQISLIQIRGGENCPAEVCMPQAELRLLLNFDFERRMS